MRILASLLLLLPLATAAQQAENTAAVTDSSIKVPAADSPEPAATVAPAAVAPEYALVDLLGGKEQILDIQSQLIDTLLSTNPELQNYQSIVQAWAQQYLDWGEVRDRLAEMYRDNFTAEELEDLLQFYRSPTGLKSVLLMPTLLRESSQIGTELAEAHRPELIDMLRAAGEQTTPETQ